MSYPGREMNPCEYQERELDALRPIASAARELVAAKRALESPVDPLAAQIRLDGALANLMELCDQTEAR